MVAVVLVSSFLSLLFSVAAIAAAAIALVVDATPIVAICLR